MLFHTLWIGSCRAVSHQTTWSLCPYGATWPISCLARISALLCGGRSTTFGSIMDIPQSRQPTLCLTSAYTLWHWWRAQRMVKNLFLTLRFGRLIRLGKKGGIFRHALPGMTAEAVLHKHANLFTAVRSVVVITQVLFICRPKEQQWGLTQETKLNCFCQLPVLMCM